MRFLMFERKQRRPTFKLEAYVIIVELPQVTLTQDIQNDPSFHVQVEQWPNLT